MSNKNSHPEGPPRLDPVERLRHRFYEPLMLLWMLCPARGAAYLMPTINQRSQDFLNAWREFLDALAWCCDYYHGGATVCAVAAESVPSGNKFWLTSRDDRPVPQISVILDLIASVSQKDRLEQREIENSIAEMSIRFCRDKVMKYCRNLSKKMDEAILATDGTILLRTCKITCKQ